MFGIDQHLVNVYSTNSSVLIGIVAFLKKVVSDLDSIGGTSPFNFSLLHSE